MSGFFWAGRALSSIQTVDLVSRSSSKARSIVWYDRYKKESMNSTSIRHFLYWASKQDTNKPALSHLTCALNEARTEGFT